MQQIYLVLTERCNLACSHCIRDSSPWRSETAEIDMMISVLTKAKEEFPGITILLTGGEPTLYKGFTRLLETCRALGLDAVVNTNGTTSFFYKSDLGVLAANGVLVQVSLDGCRSHHDTIRGHGAFDRSLRTLQRLVSAGVRCSVSATVIDASFFDGVEELFADLDNLGLAHIAIKRATYAGRASTGTPLRSAEWNAGVYSVRAIARKTRIRMTPMYDFVALAALNEAEVTAIDTGPYGTNCGAGVAKIYLYPNGDLCSCTCFRDVPMGNVYTTKFSELVRAYSPLRVNSEVCGSCRYFRICRGGCLGSGYRYSGVLGSADPRCTRIELASASRLNSALG